jgi:hypothetical protein
MVYNTQNYWVIILFPSSGIVEKRETTFRKLDLFPSSGAAGENTPTPMGPLEKPNLNHWPNRVGFFSPLYLRNKTDPVSETSCFIVSRIPDGAKIQKPSSSVKSVYVVIFRRYLRGSPVYV